MTGEKLTARAEAAGVDPLNAMAQALLRGPMWFCTKCDKVWERV